SSRRRHTRFSRDWSSDVCSSDLLVLEFECRAAEKRHKARGRFNFRNFRHQCVRHRRTGTGSAYILTRDLSVQTYLIYAFIVFMRSEERRIGKECRAWWVSGGG